MGVPLPMRISAWKIFLIFLKLGFISFGGPIAHLGYFREEFVHKRRWLSDEEYADLVALCQFLPGPASSQIGIALGLSKARYLGALAAWLGFTMPSAIALILFALGMTSDSAFISDGIVHGLKIVAVAIVAQAIWGMAKILCPDRHRIMIMLMTTCFILWLPSLFSQVIVIFVAGIVGILLFKPPISLSNNCFNIPISERSGVAGLVLFFGLLLILPLITMMTQNPTWGMIDLFYRVGSLVFGGGHVVLPLLQTEVVSTGMVNQDLFLAGYGASQAVPGPLFTFAAFLGASMNEMPNSWLGGVLALIAIFLPSFLLVIGVLPFWTKLQQYGFIKAALMGINAAVVGILLAAFYQPIWTSAIFDAVDFSIALIAFVGLVFWKIPPWLIVVVCGLAGLLSTVY